MVYPEKNKRGRFLDSLIDIRGKKVSYEPVNSYYRHLKKSCWIIMPRKNNRLAAAYQRQKAGAGDSAGVIAAIKLGCIF